MLEKLPANACGRRCGRDWLTTEHRQTVRSKTEDLPMESLVAEKGGRRSTVTHTVWLSDVGNVRTYTVSPYCKEYAICTLRGLGKVKKHEEASSAEDRSSPPQELESQSRYTPRCPRRVS